MEKKRSVGVITILLLTLPFVCLAQDVTMQATPKYEKVDLKVTKANEIMENIYNDILKIKDSYEELKDFGKKSLTGDKDALLSIDYGWPRKGEFAGKGDIWIYIIFSENPYHKGLDQFKSKDFYIEDIGLYLRCAIWTEPSLKNKILQIIQSDIPAPK